MHCSVTLLHHRPTASLSLWTSEFQCLHDIKGLLDKFSHCISVSRVLQPQHPCGTVCSAWP